MALVAYGSDFSDSEDEVSETKIEILNRNENDDPPSVKRGNQEPTISLFKTLPMPKKNTKLLNNEEDDQFLNKKAMPSEELLKTSKLQQKSERKPAQITFPSLANFDDDEEQPTTPKFKPSVKGTGLLSLLPLPKSTPNKESFKKFIPHVIADKSAKIKNAQIAKFEKKPSQQKKISLINNYGSSEESDPEDSEKAVDFFSLKDNPLDCIEPSEESFVDNCSSIMIGNTEVPFNIIAHASPPERHFQPEPIYYDSTPEENASTSNDVNIDSEVLKKLCGIRARHKGENMQIIDINQKEIMPDPREWLTKALTEDNSKRMSSSKRRGDEPTTQQRRKHQITYLAHQAKMNEQELQSQWANNRLTKKQTQSKYGF